MRMQAVLTVAEFEEAAMAVRVALGYLTKELRQPSTKKTKRKKKPKRTREAK